MPFIEDSHLEYPSMNTVEHFHIELERLVDQASQTAHNLEREAGCLAQEICALSAILQDVDRALQESQALGTFNQEQAGDAQRRIRACAGSLDTNQRSIFQSLNECTRFIDTMLPNLSAQVEQVDEDGWES
jgi:hypothetical protein